MLAALVYCATLVLLYMYNYTQLASNSNNTLKITSQLLWYWLWCTCCHTAHSKYRINTKLYTFEVATYRFHKSESGDGVDFDCKGMAENYLSGDW